jgi:hypothetical protein
VTRIVLHIDRVVVEGTALTPRDAEALRRGLEADLGVRLAGVVRRGGIVAATVARHRAAEIDGGGDASTIGQAAARSVVEALRPLMGPRGSVLPGGKDARLEHG